eukprot:365802-Chlamydomonas_euryale.AAC.8
MAVGPARASCGRNLRANATHATHASQIFVFYPEESKVGVKTIKVGALRAACLVCHASVAALCQSCRQSGAVLDSGQPYPNWVRSLKPLNFDIGFEEMTRTSAAFEPRRSVVESGCWIVRAQLQAPGGCSV